MFSAIYDFIEKNPFKKFLILLLIGIPLVFFDSGFGLILIIISFIYGIFLVKGKLKILAIGIMLNVSTGLLFYNELSKGISYGEVIEKTFLYWVVSILFLLFGIYWYKKFNK
tara:strand:+ start:92 stop:427 length:336 start_codon:yes stop_codon:yes gene_type:complete